MTGGVIHATETVKGGTGSYLRELIALQRAKYGAGVITVVAPESQRADLHLPDDVEVITFADDTHRINKAWRLAGLVRRLAIQRSPAVLHIHNTYAGVTARLALAVTRHSARVIYCPHGWAFDREASTALNGAARAIERLFSSLCDVVICISQHERDAALKIGIPSSRLALVMNGVRAQPPEPSLDPGSIAWPEGRKRLLFVGRFDRQKGVDVLLKAMSQLGDSAFAYLIGDKVLNDDSLPEELPANVRLTGWLSPMELEAYYRSADALVVPSRWEGFGLIAVEAMRAGLPVIASRVGGLPEVVKDGVTGVLVPAGDADTLARVLAAQDRHSLRTMGCAGKSRFHELYAMERVQRQLDALYGPLSTNTTATSTLPGTES